MGPSALAFYIVRAIPTYLEACSHRVGLVYKGYPSDGQCDF